MTGGLNNHHHTPLALARPRVPRRPRQLGRRRFLTLTAAAAALAFTVDLPATGTAAAATLDAARIDHDPFTLGIASGDTLPTSVVLWTRLAPAPYQADGGLPARPVDVDWEMSRDETFATLAAKGTTTAFPEFNHAVHVEVQGLDPGRAYYYRFRTGTWLSETGRTRTAPAADSAAPALSFAAVSCQQYQDGYFTAHRHLAQDDVDLVFHLGDYMYEYPVDAVGGARNYTDRVLPDLYDHETDNNYAGSIPEDGTPPADFLLRRAAAYRAYWENQPLRAPQLPVGPDARLYRRLRWGLLAQFDVLDTRQYRSDQAYGDGKHVPGPESEDPARTMTGAAQKRWLIDGWRASRALWNVVPQQSPT